MILELPWPDKRLSPNARVHHMVLAKCKKIAKDEAYWLTIKSLTEPPKFSAGNIAIKVTFHPPDKRRRDDDNCIASCKAMRDGIALGLGVDDYRFRPATYDWGDPVKGGMVVFEIETI